MPVPTLKIKPSASVLWGLSLVLPFAYLLCLTLTQNQYIPFFQILFFLIPSFWLLRRYQIQSIPAPHIATNLTLTIAVSLAATVGLNEVLAYWLQIFPVPEEFRLSFQAMFSLGKPYGLYLDLLTIALIPSVAEEFFFRGFLQSAFATHFGPKIALLITSVIFAIYHVNPWFIPFYLLLGLLFGWIAQRTKSHWYAALAHFVNNAYGVIMVYWLESSGS